MASLGLTDATGLVGVAAYVTAHFAVTVLHKSPAGRLAVALNVIGPVCILVSLIGAFNLPSFLTQCFWLGLTVLGWWRNRRRKQRAAKAALHGYSHGHSPGITQPGKPMFRDMATPE